MAMRWYVVHAYSNFEHRVAESLKDRIKRDGLEDKFGEDPRADRRSRRDARGQKRRSERKFYPGYVLVQMEMDEQTWHLVRDVPKVLGFIGGTSDKPAPISEKEANQILRRVEEGVDKPRPKVLFEPGQVVRVTDGPFNDFNGVVESVNYEKSRLQVAVQILGRSTPVELDSLKSRRLRPSSSGERPTTRSSRRRAFAPRSRRWPRKYRATCKLQVPAGSANPSPPIGPALGQQGVNIMEFCKQFNAQTQKLEKGLPIPVMITVYCGPQLHLHHEDAAGVGADPQGASASKRAAARRTPRRSARSRASSSKKLPRRRCRTSPRPTSKPP